LRNAHVDYSDLLPRRSSRAEAEPDNHGVEADGSSDASRRWVVQSVGRAFEILNVLKEAPLPMSALEIANASGLDRTVVHRLLRTLSQHGMAVEERGSFQLGPASVLLAHRYLDNLLVRRLALPYLLDLQGGAVGDRPWTVTLSIPVDDVTTVIERIWTRAAPLGMVLDIGDTFPIDLGAAGRSVLAYRSEAEARALLGDERYDAVAPTLHEVRDAGGVALSRGEARAGVYAVAAGILSRRGKAVASVSVSGLDLGDELAYDSSLAGHLRQAAHAVGQSLS
jgi:IclR family acetate operon transcriptional repressor